MIGLGDCFQARQDASDRRLVECPGCERKFRSDSDWHKHAGKDYCGNCIGHVQATTCKECGAPLPPDGRTDARSCPDCNLLALDRHNTNAERLAGEIHVELAGASAAIERAEALAPWDEAIVATMVEVRAINATNERKAG